ncbi:hypothetical protein GCM10010140_35920 [Streptosporangium pseudovulgare]|uniref:ESX-1 secretion-associated protein n=2 Tax=Streptosporangium pseudovulgare TaxID=35765 RepID=A0ABQ2R126_9ACTN|nr:hypothetical protein GCM10010140_35920 [Streptosporangium pseudovulgare]
MAGVDIHFQMLDQCRTTAKTLAGKFEELGGQYPAKTADSSVFGRLTDSSGLAAALDTVEKTLDDQLGRVGKKLRLVERALDQVQDNVRGANRAGGGS